MKVKFWCDSGANIHSNREEDLDVEKDLGYTEQEWKEMSYQKKYKEAEIWAWEKLEIGFQEIE